MTHADKLVSSGPPPDPTTTTSNAGMQIARSNVYEMLKVLAVVTWLRCILECEANAALE